MKKTHESYYLVKAEYLKGELTQPEIALKYGITLNDLKSTITKEGWSAIKQVTYKSVDKEYYNWLKEKLKGSLYYAYEELEKIIKSKNTPAAAKISAIKLIMDKILPDKLETENKTEHKINFQIDEIEKDI